MMLCDSMVEEKTWYTFIDGEVGKIITGCESIALLCLFLLLKNYQWLKMCNVFGQSTRNWCRIRSSELTLEIVVKGKERVTRTQWESQSRKCQIKTATHTLQSISERAEEYLPWFMFSSTFTSLSDYIQPEARGQAYLMPALTSPFRVQSMKLGRERWRVDIER